MPNPIKYSTGTETLALKKGDFYIGTEDVSKGPTSGTSYYNGITPPSSGYTIYLNKSVQGPSIYCPSDDNEMIFITNKITGLSFTSATQCLEYYNIESNKMALNRDYEPIITSGMVFSVDAGFTPSYPKVNNFLSDMGGNVSFNLKNIGIPLTSWAVKRSDISLITDNSITPPFSGAQVWSSTINTALYPNTLHRTWNDGSINGVIGTLGQGYYRYYMWVRGKSTNSSTASISIDISDGSAPGTSGNVLIGNNENWQLISTWDNGGVNYNSIKFFDYQLTGVNGDTYYISGICIIRSDVSDAADLKVLYTFPGYVNYSATTTSDLDGILTNGPTYTSSNGGAITFDGVDDSVICSSYLQQFFTGRTPYSIEVWVKQNITQTGYPMVASNEGMIATVRNGVSLTLWSANTSNSQVIHERFGSGNQFTRSITVPHSSLTGSPFNMVATYDGTKIQCYFNGSGSTTITDTSLITNPTTPFRLGSRGQAGNYFNGNIYVTRIYNRALTDSEVLTNYQSMLPRFLGENIVTNGLVSYFDAGYPSSYGGGGTTWYDISGYGLFGTLTNGTTYNPSEGGGSFVFDGTDDYVSSIGAESSFSFIQNSGIFTISAWVRPSVLGTDMYIMGNNDGSTSRKGFHFGKLSDNRSWFVITYGTPGSATVQYSSAGFYTDTNWVNITITSNGTSAKAHKNGIPFGSASNPYGTLSSGDSSRNLNIGRINLAGVRTWDGNIAIVQIYNRELTSSEVLQNYNVQKTRFGL